MKSKFIHPLWTHLPAILALLAGVVFTLKAMPLPDPAPLHFTWNGQPDRYGSPWMSAIWQAAISILYIVLSIVLDEAWKALEQSLPSQAAELYSSLIKQDYRLDEVITDLQDALYNFPLDVNLWVDLGDAYFRKENLQEALNAYTKAEELVR